MTIQDYLASLGYVADQGREAFTKLGVPDVPFGSLAGHTVESFQRWLETHVGTAPYVVGVDVARGGDKTILAIRKGRVNGAMGGSHHSWWSYEQLVKKVVENILRARTQRATGKNTGGVEGDLTND